MATCSFCGHENPPGTRSCIACGDVFDEASAGTARRASDGSADDTEVRHLAHLYDPGPVAKAVRQATLLAGVAAALAVWVGIAATIDVFDALGRLDGTAVFFTDDAVPTIAGRSDLVSLAEHSLFAGVLVMLGGWAQEVGAARSLLGVDTPARDAAGMVRAFVVLGPNIVTGGRAVRELWSDNAPPGGATDPPPLAVRWFGGVFAAAVSARLASVLWGFTLASTPRRDGDAFLAGAVVVGTRLLWVAALVLAVIAARAVAARQRERARRLADA